MRTPPTTTRTRMLSQLLLDLGSGENHSPDFANYAPQLLRRALKAALICAALHPLLEHRSAQRTVSLAVAKDIADFPQRKSFAPRPVRSRPLHLNSPFCGQAAPDSRWQDVAKHLKKLFFFVFGTRAF